jgi:2-desacetyl-2-hydroxyethyl bacteriochlorophyllide A dehydrogenase
VGEVVEAGEKVDGVQPGDMVLTTGGGLWGMTNLFGGSHARELVAEASGVIKLRPGKVPLETAAYGVLGAVAWDGIARMKLEPGNVLIVFGLGMLGQLAGGVARLLGVRVVGVNRSAWKRDAAREFGFDAVAAPDQEEIEKAVNALGCGPAKFAYETTGSQRIIDLAFASLGSYGELSLGGYCPGKYEIDYDFCHSRNLSIHNPVWTGGYLADFIRLAEDRGLDITSLIRTRIKPEEVASFYSDLITNHSNYLGVVIDWFE